MSEEKLAPLPLWTSLVAGLLPAALFYVTHFYLVPLFLDLTGYPYLIGYLVGWGGTMALIFFASLGAYASEGNPVAWRAFAARYRLHRMTRGDWMWAGVVLVIILATYFGLTFTAKWLASMPGFSPPDFYPPELRPGGVSSSPLEVFFGMRIVGQWWIPIAYFIGWFFNIFGEEFWFRGYLLPRQERAHGEYAWLLNGLLFTVLHMWQKWNLLLLLPGALAAAHVVQRRRNTWILIVAHGISNLGGLIACILAAVG